MKRQLHECIEVEPPPPPPLSRLDDALQRLTDYYEKDEKDYTKRLFQALLELGPEEGRHNIVDWICLPRLPKIENLELAYFDSRETDKCDDTALRKRASWWFHHFIMPGIILFN